MIMYLRQLELKDIPFMLSWMHDDQVTNHLYNNFSGKTAEDVETFIVQSQKKGGNVHLAVSSDSDEYMGTVSLKHIDYKAKTAEFAIVVRKEAMGKGYAWYGMKTILNKAFEDLGLENIYWCVSKKNIRAIRFYDKHNFNEILDVSKEIRDRYKGINDLKWYSVRKGSQLEQQTLVAGCKVIHIKTIATLNVGELSFFEGIRDVPFDIKRLYYISRVSEGLRRGFHAHKQLKQVLFCPYGKIQLSLDNGREKAEIELLDPSVGILIEKPVWREMLWLQKDSVLCVAASDYYDADDYIRNYEVFREYMDNLRD